MQHSCTLKFIVYIVFVFVCVLDGERVGEESKLLCWLEYDIKSLKFCNETPPLFAILDVSNDGLWMFILHMIFIIIRETFNPYLYSLSLTEKNDNLVSKPSQNG